MQVVFKLGSYFVKGGKITFLMLNESGKTSQATIIPSKFVSKS